MSDQPIVPVEYVYVVFRAYREPGKRPSELRWRRIASCMTREQAIKEAQPSGPYDGTAIHAVFSIGCFGVIGHIYQDAVDYSDPDSYALRSIPWSIPVAEAWQMLVSCANLGFLSSQPHCQADSHSSNETRFNPWPECKDCDCGGRCGKPCTGKFCS